MIKQYTERLSDFMGSQGNFEEAQVIILGVPLEVTVSFRPGTRFGPQYIRSNSYGIEEYSIDQDRHLEEISYYDAGDLALPLGNLGESLNLIKKAAAIVFRSRKRPFFMGGEHLVSLPLIEAAHAVYPDLAVVHFDAHADLRDDYLGQHLSHATVMRRVSEDIGPENLFQFGIRSGSREEVAFARSKTHTVFNRVLEPLIDFSHSFNPQRPLYVSIDVDVLDPAFAPGTGTPEPGGISASELLQAVRALHGLNIVGADLVEVSPPNDLHGVTSVLGAKIIREALLSWW